MKLAFYRSCKGNWLDTLIDLASGRYGYSHVELVFDRISTDTTHGNLCFSSSPREGKCRFKNIVLKETHWNFVNINIPLKEEQRIYSECFNYLNAKYDYYGILFWYVLFWVKKQKNKKW